MSVTFCTVTKASLLQLKTCVLFILSDNLCPKSTIGGKQFHVI